MKQNYYCYLDAFDIITIIIPKEMYHPNTKYQLHGNDEIINLDIKEVTNIGDEEKIITSFDAYINLEVPYQVVSNDNNRAELFVGKIVRTALFDSIYYYKKDDLGIVYTKESTKFKIWSPVAKQVIIELISPSGEKKERHLFYKSQGVWKTEEDGDLEGYKYRYHIYVNGKIKTCLDPYAISSTVNNEYNYVVDSHKFYQMQYGTNRPSSSLNSIIYETSIRDFTYFFKDDNERSTYAFFTKENLVSKDGNAVGFDYLKSLGITHVQLLPFYSFGGVDENDRFKKYNWGYNPVQYNVPSGLYSLNPNDPYDRINSLKRMIDEIHKAGLNVVMDVVFNHVYLPDEFPFEILCPGYSYVYNVNGIRTNYSGCSNDINSAKKMMRKFILDSIMYWTKEFNIDGFRMDIMGLIDFETVNDIRGELDNIDPSILLYGEGWKMVQSNAADSLAHMFNKNVHPSVGFFNDKAREAIKTYAVGDDSSLAILKEVVLGCSSARFMFKYTTQSVNYVECHDDMTLYDSLRKKKEMSIKEAKERATLATSMILLSQGIPFIHSAQEFFRTKDMESNTYNMGDRYNMIKWNFVDTNVKYINEIKEVISIRKRYHTLFSILTSTELQSRIDISFTEKSTMLYKINIQDEMLIIFKNNTDEELIALPKDYKIIFSSSEAEIIDSSIKICAIGTSILVKE